MGKTGPDKVSCVLTARDQTSQDIVDKLSVCEKLKYCPPPRQGRVYFGAWAIADSLPIAGTSAR